MIERLIVWLLIRINRFLRKQIDHLRGLAYDEPDGWGYPDTEGEMITPDGDWDVY